MPHPSLICFLLSNHTGFLSGSQILLEHVSVPFPHMPQHTLFSVPAVSHQLPITWLSSVHPTTAKYGSCDV